MQPHPHSPSCGQCTTRGKSFFCSLKENDLNLIDREKSMLRFRPGQTLFYAGNPAIGVYCIQRGMVKLEAQGKEGQNHLLHIVQKGGMIGYEALFAGIPHQNTATALEDCEVCLIPNKVFRNLTLSNPEMAIKLISQLATELREAEARLCNSTDLGASERIAEAVLFLTDHFKDRNWTRREISEWAGTTTETVIRTLSQFKKEGLIDQKGRVIGIRNREALNQRAGIF